MISLRPTGLYLLLRWIRVGVAGGGRDVGENAQLSLIINGG
jgi:hypothetical protein